MPQLRSSNLASDDYDTETRTLTITFKSGKVYTYADVPPDIVAGLEAAASPGSYFAANIRDTFTHTKG